jgi:excisionase family DNA binding protein
MSFPSGDEGLEDSGSASQMGRATLEPVVYAVLEHIVERAVVRLWVRSMLGDAVGVPIKIAAEVLGCKESKIYELLSNGSLKRVPKHGKETLISLASIKELLEGGPPKKGRRKKGNGGGGGWSNGSGLQAGVMSRVTPPSSSAEQPSSSPSEEIRKLTI